MIKPVFKIFLEDGTSYFDKIGDYFYLKVPYNQNLILLYMSDKFSLTSNKMEYVGVYSLNMGEFLTMSSSYFCVKICDDNDKDIKDLEADLDHRVQNELVAILESLISPNSVISQEAQNMAKDFKMKGEEPIFSFHEYEGNKLSLENLEEFFLDPDEYAYNIAEKIINDNKQCIEEYQLFADVMKALNLINQSLPIDLELEMAITEIQQETGYKNLKIYVLKDGIIQEEAIQIDELKKYPFYAINKIYWGRKMLFDISNYDLAKVESLRTNREYNLKAVKSAPNSSRGTIWDYVDKRMFSDYDFCMEICEHFSNQYKNIDESFRSNMSFIQNSKVSAYNLFQYTPESTILGNKSYFLNILSDNTDYFCYLPKRVREDLDFICTYISINGKDAIRELPEDAFQYDEVQKAFDDWFLAKPTNLMTSSCYSERLKISFLKNENTKIYALSIPYLKSLTEKELNDKNFIHGFFSRIKVVNTTTMLSADNFSQIYTSLIDLKADMDILTEMLSFCNVDESCWRVLEDCLKTKDIQRAFVEKHATLISQMDEDIKLEYIYKDPKKYLMLSVAEETKMYWLYGRKQASHTSKKDVDEKLLLDLIKVKGDDLSFLSTLNYNQLNDEKLGMKMMKVNREVYKYLGTSLRGKYEFAVEAVKEFSVIPFLPTKSKHCSSLFDNREIMEKSLKWKSEDFYNIPQASRQTGPAPLLSNKDFVLYAVQLDSYNANYIDPKTGLLEDEDICCEAVVDDINTIGAFSGKLFRNESFVYRICEEMEKKINNLQSDDIKNIWYTEVKSLLISNIPKKIKDTSAFKAKFPNFV